MLTFFFQRVEKELQEKAEAAQLPAKREAGDGGETGAAEPALAAPRDTRERWGTEGRPESALDLALALVCQRPTRLSG